MIDLIQYSIIAVFPNFIVLYKFALMKNIVTAAYHALKVILKINQKKSIHKTQDFKPTAKLSPQWLILVTKQI